MCFSGIPVITVDQDRRKTGPNCRFDVIARAVSDEKDTGCRHAQPMHRGLKNSEVRLCVTRFAGYRDRIEEMANSQRFQDGIDACIKIRNDAELEPETLQLFQCIKGFGKQYPALSSTKIVIYTIEE